VGPGPRKEIGWAPVELSDAGARSALRHLEGIPVLHWHGDNLALPAGCEHLASTPHCPVQAFRRGGNVLGLQFHLELEPRRIESWLIGHTVEIGKAGIDPRQVRDETRQHGETLRAVGATVFGEWLDQIRPAAAG
jgi:GMP synthase (glutamine-hydrolysing)